MAITSPPADPQKLQRLIAWRFERGRKSAARSAVLRELSYGEARTLAELMAATGRGRGECGEALDRLRVDEVIELSECGRYALKGLI